MTKLKGSAAIYGEPTAIDIQGTIWEEIDHGAFRSSISEQSVVAYFQHDRQGQPLGRQSNSTLQLFDELAGLRFSLDLPATSLGRDVAELVRVGTVSGMSFSFIPQHESAYRLPDGRTVFVVEKALLLEISPVVSPGYPQTNVSAGERSWDAELLELYRRRLAWSAPRNRHKRTVLPKPRSASRRSLVVPVRFQEAA